MASSRCGRTQGSGRPAVSALAPEARGQDGTCRYLMDRKLRGVTRGDAELLM